MEAITVSHTTYVDRADLFAFIVAGLRVVEGLIGILPCERSVTRGKTRCNRDTWLLRPCCSPGAPPRRTTASRRTSRQRAPRPESTPRWVIGCARRRDRKSGV